MFIQTEQTPNPATLKFLPGCEVMIQGVAEFQSAEDAAKASPLAEKLFTVEQVTGVFLGSDFISVTKDENADWNTLSPMILAVIMDHFTSGAPVMLDEAQHESGHKSSATDEDDEVVTQIKEILDTRVRPAVAQDGGDIVFDSFQDGIVYLHMRGACAGCPSSTATLKAGIENMLKHFIPEVEEVRAIN